MESVDSISKDGLDTSIYVIQHKTTQLLNLQNHTSYPTRPKTSLESVI